MFNKKDYGANDNGNDFPVNPNGGPDGDGCYKDHNAWYQENSNKITSIRLDS